MCVTHSRTHEPDDQRHSQRPTERLICICVSYLCLCLYLYLCLYLCLCLSKTCVSISASVSVYVGHFFLRCMCLVHVFGRSLTVPTGHSPTGHRLCHVGLWAQSHRAQTEDVIGRSLTVPTYTDTLSKTYRTHSV